MKIKLPTAESVRNKQLEQKSLKEESLRSIVENFLNGKVMDAINSAMNNEYALGVNVEVPPEAYGNKKEFYRICDELLRPLGYTSKENHDGGGQYLTLDVDWEIKNSR